MWNNPNDPMPIKTINMAGLQKWEETEDYIIYINKDAVMTTVAKYAPGSYQTFMERKADIESSNDLIKSYNIEWTHEDNSNLFIQLNNEALEKLESQPMMLPIEGEEPTQPIVLEPKTVPTTYECCFRVDKSSGEIYIGEGYENLLPTEAGWGGTISVMDSNGISTFTKRLPAESVAHVKLITKTTFAPGVKFSVNYEIIQDGNEVNFKYLQSYSGGMVETGVLTGFENSGSFLIKENYHQDNILFWFTDKIVENSYVKAKIQITKTSTPKPFVKSIMPSGKLAFVTNATSETHSFVMKGAFSKTQKITCHIYFAQDLWSSETYEFVKTKTVPQIGVETDIYFSKNYRTLVDVTNSGKTTGGLYFHPKNARQKEVPDSFKQLLIYKANLTEAELKAELAKDIKLATNNTQMHTQI